MGPGAVSKAAPAARRISMADLIIRVSHFEVPYPDVERDSS